MDLQRFQNPGHNMSFGIQSDGANKNNKNEKPWLTWLSAAG